MSIDVRSIFNQPEIYLGKLGREAFFKVFYPDTRAVDSDI